MTQQEVHFELVSDALDDLVEWADSTDQVEERDALLGLKLDPNGSSGWLQAMDSLVHAAEWFAEDDEEQAAEYAYLAEIAGHYGDPEVCTGGLPC